MSIIFGYFLFDVIAVLVTGLIGLYTYFKWAYKYWEKRNVPYVEPIFPFGTIGNILSQPESFGERTKNQYFEYKSQGHKHVGLFVLSVPLYLTLDLEVIKNIMSKDFNHFTDRGVYFNEKDDPLSAHLFAIEGVKWRNLRVKLTPTFTSGKMKMMFSTLIECGNQLKDAMDDYCSTNKPIEVKDVLARFTMDVIGSCAFGLDCNSFKDPNSEFSKRAKRVFLPTKVEMLKNFLSFASPPLARRLGLCVTPNETTDFFMKVITDTVEYREKNNYARPDFMQLLIDLKNNVREEGDNQHGTHHDGKGLTLYELAAQAFVFFLAGYETSSTTMNFCLYELTINTEIQQKVREEVNTILEKYDGQITYDAVFDMKYMGQVLDETLRKYPPLPTLHRKCVEEYKVPGTDLIIEKGCGVVIPIFGLHHDPEYFPNPETFDPDRFSEKNKSKIRPYSYMPFGEGPRNCIGLRFGLMQAKVGLAILLKNYRFSLNSKTTTPLKMDPMNIVLAPLGGIWLDAKKIED